MSFSICSHVFYFYMVILIKPIYPLTGRNFFNAIILIYFILNQSISIIIYSIPILSCTPLALSLKFSECIFCFSDLRHTFFKEIISLKRF